MSSKVDYSKIASYFNGINVPSSGASDIAKAILLNADVKRGAAPSQTSSDSPSLMGRIFDILSRPRYALVDTLIKGPEGLWKGLSGQDKPGFSDLLQKEGVTDPFIRNMAGFGLDLVADPINFVPVAPLVKGAKEGINALRGVEKAAPPVETALQSFVKKGELMHPENFGLPAGPKPVSIPDVLAGKAAISDVPKDILATKVPEGIKPISPDILPKPPLINPTSVLTKPLSKLAEFEPRHQLAADNILAKFDPAKSTAQINKTHPDTLNAKQQVWLYHRAIQEAKRTVKNPTWVASHANKIYAAVESALREKGYVPRLGTGENVSLYDVIKQTGNPTKYASTVLDNFAKDLTPKNPITHLVDKVRATSAVEDSNVIQHIADNASQSKALLQASNTLSDAAEAKVLNVVKNISKQTAKVSGISPVAVDTAGKVLEHVMVLGKAPAQLAIEQKANMIADILSKGHGPRGELNQAVTRALEKNLSNLPKWVVNDNKAVEFMMGRVATSWGQKDLRPFSLNAIGSSASTAAARGQRLFDLFKGLDDNQAVEALMAAQGMKTATSPGSAAAADQIAQMMDNLMSKSVGNSVVTRGVLDREMINKWMRHYKVGFEFNNSKKFVNFVTGETLDLSKGVDWLDTWRHVQVKEDPQKWIFKLQQALEQSTREKALFDEIGERFGQKIPGGSFKVKLEGYPYLQGYYFSEDIAKQLPRVIADWTLPPTMTDPLIRLYDRLLSMWKTGVTIYRPAHHIRNLVGDAYLGWLDGVNSVRPYTLAARVQRTLKGMYPTLADVDKLVELGAVGKQFSTPKVGEVLFRNKTGHPFTAEQIAAVAHQKGLLEHARTIEDIIDLGDASKFKPFGGKVQAVARGASELISHNTRLAHFIDKVMKSRGSALDVIFENAARRARKWHPTGIDLTSFERKFMRRVIPFYAWMRKSTPLLLEGMLMNPGKVLAVPKTFGAIQQAQGIQTNGIADPFPVDQMFPSWLKSEGIGPISDPTGFLGKFSNQSPPGYTMAGLGLNPLSTMVAQAAQPGKTLISSLTPLVGVPLALAAGKNLSTGQDITGPDAQPGAMAEYIGQQIPLWSMAQGITGVTPFGTQTKRGQSGDQTTEAFLNWLTAAGIKGTGPYIKQARYEKTRPAQVERTAQKNAFLAQLRQMTGG